MWGTMPTGVAGVAGAADAAEDAEAAQVGADVADGVATAKTDPTLRGRPAFHYEIRAQPSVLAL